MIGKGLGAIAPLLGWVFIGGLVLALLTVLYFILREFVRARWPDVFKRKPAAAKPAPWRPEAAVARALIEEAQQAGRRRPLRRGGAPHPASQHRGDRSAARGS